MHLLDFNVDLKTQGKISGGRSNAATGHQDVKIAEASFIKLAKFIGQVCGSSNGQQALAAGRKRDADALEETAGSASVGERGGSSAAPLGGKQTLQDKKRRPNAVGASNRSGGGGGSSSSSRSGSCGRSGGRVNGKGNSGGGGGGGTTQDDAEPPGRRDRTRTQTKRFNFSTDGADDSARRKSKEK